MKFTHLVVGLGNPEGKYFQTYHNVGFLAVEDLAKNLKIDFKKKGNQLIAPGFKVLLLKPLTYMNLSGQAVVAVCRKRKIAPENVIVICDDLYIDKGHIRISRGGSGGGHNGLRSITDLLQTPSYTRIRIGIKPEKEPHSTATYVLSKIDIESRVKIDEGINKSIEVCLDLLNGVDIEKLQCKHNTKNTAEKK